LGIGDKTIDDGLKKCSATQMKEGYGEILAMS
jgi:hypothetical protein